MSGERDNKWLTIDETKWLERVAKRPGGLENLRKYLVYADARINWGQICPDVCIPFACRLICRLGGEPVGMLEDGDH